MRGFIGYFAGAQRFTHSLSRARVAYLLRAARSRRANNVIALEGRGYRLRDCSYIITRVSI